MNVTLFLGMGFLIAIVVSGLMIHAGIGDTPDHRSSHETVVPTGGGLGIVAALGLSAIFYSNASGFFPLTATYAQVLSLVFAIGFLGLMDDVLDLAAPFKLFFMLVVSIAGVYILGPVSHLPYAGVLSEIPKELGWIISVLWIFGVMNVVNFMDGINGLMLVVMGIASFFLALIALSMDVIEPFVLLVTLTSAIAGLAVYNCRPKANVFSGDVGALTIGFVFAISLLWISTGTQKGNPIYAGPILILPFLVDGFLTMLARARRNEELMQAHRSHLYQRLNQSGLSHMTVTFLYGVAALLLGLFAYNMIEAGQFHLLNFPLMPAIIVGVIYLLVARRLS